MKRAATVVLLLAGLAHGAPAAAQLSLGPPPVPPYVAPGGLFSVKLPPGWEPAPVPGKPDLIEIKMVNRPGTAFLQIQRLPVAEGARARQLLARNVEDRLRKLPHYREVSRRDVELSGLRAATVTGHYWYQGNVQFPRAVEEVALVLGREAFLLHFECFEPLANPLAGELNAIYTSFTPRPGNDTRLTPPADEEDPWDRVPF